MRTSMSLRSPFLGARRRLLADRLAVALGLSAGAVGASSLAQAGDVNAPQTPHTLLLPKHYKIFEGGRAVFALESGEQLSLTSDQYVLLDGDLLLVVDERAQNTVAQLPVRGSLRTQLLSEVEPVRNQEGNIVEVSSTQPLWSGEGPAPRLFEEIDLQTYDFSQADLADATEGEPVGSSLSLAASSSLASFILGVFGLTFAQANDDPQEVPLPVSGGGAGGFSGAVIKGPLLNAFVFLDENGNGLFDAGEPSVTTDATGAYSISSSAANPELIVTTSDQTVDTSTGTVLSGMTFKAPAEASVVTPLTTMMEETGLSAAQIKSVLGLPASVDPLTFNPYAAGVNAGDALATEQASAQTMATLAAFAAAAAGTGIAQHDAFAAALSALSTVMQAKDAGGTSLDLSDAMDLGDIQTAFTAAVSTVPGVTGAQTTDIAAIISDVTSAIQNVNTKIASIITVDLSNPANANIFGLLQVLQDQVEQAAEDETATPGSGTIGFTDPTAVNNAATNSPPTDIDLSASSISEDASSLVVGVLTTTDDTTTDFNFTYEIAEIEGSTDHSAFSINQANGELSFVAQPDFDTQSSYTIIIKATDGGGKAFSQTFTITVTEVVNDYDPVFTSGTTFNAAENQLQTGYTPSATDADGQTVSFSIHGGADAALFELDGVTDALTFKAAPDFETPTDSGGNGTYDVQILASDRAGRSATQSVSIAVTDVDESAPNATVNNPLVQVAPGGTLAPIALTSFASFSDAAPGTIASVTASGAGTIALTPTTVAGSLSGTYVGVTTDGSTWTSTPATLTLVATDSGGLTATTSLTVAEQLSLDETDLSSAEASYTVTGSDADDTVNLGTNGSLAVEPAATAHTVTINLGDGNNHFEASHVAYGGGEVFTYTGGSGTDTAIVNGQIAANDGIATFTMGDGANSLELLVDQIRLAKTQGAGSFDTTSVFSYTGGADNDTVTIRNDWNGAADNYIGSDGDVYFNMGNGNNALVIDTQDLIYFSLYNGTVTYTGGTGSDTIDLSVNARVNTGMVVDFGADSAADTLTAGRLETGFVIRNLDPSEDSVRLGIEGFAPTSYNVTMNGADAEVTYVLSGVTRGFTAEGVTLTNDDIQISGDYLLL
ncbi:MAG: hypothetical protein EVA88_01955 [Rhodospirillaceae bacterium]|nr:MAG: hypothetical protein EVA88_01955 [Rhodospirillaceae bacterium]